MRNNAAVLDGKRLKQNRKAWNGEPMSKPKRDRKTYSKVTRMHLYTVNILPTQARARLRGSRRRAASNACYAEQRSFELLSSAEAMWAIREPSTVRIGVRRGASLRPFENTGQSGGNEGGKRMVGGKARREAKSGLL